MLLPLVFRKGAYGGPSSDVGKATLEMLHFLFVSELEKRKQLEYAIGVSFLICFCSQGLQ